MAQINLGYRYMTKKLDVTFDPMPLRRNLVLLLKFNPRGSIMRIIPFGD
jgi:hypothetical protein